MTKRPFTSHTRIPLQVKVADAGASLILPLLDPPPNAVTLPLEGTDRLIRDTEGAAILACSKATWWHRVSDGTLPRPIRIGGISRWKLSDVLNLIENLSATTASGKAQSGETSPRATRPAASARDSKC